MPDGSFLIASTRDGWRHLYRYAADGTLLNAVTAGPWEVREVHRVVGLPGTPADLSVKGGGNDSPWIFFTGTKDDPRGEFLYRVRPDGSGLARLTPEDGTHKPQVAPGGAFLVDAYSAHDVPTRVTLRRGDGELLRVLGEATPTGVTQTARGRFTWVEIPVPAAARADGGTDPAGVIHGYLLTPPGLDLSNPDRQVPTWVMTYGGPHTPVVRDDWARGPGLGTSAGDQRRSRC